MPDAAPALSPPPFACRRTEHGRISTTTVSGELDISTVGELQRALTAGQAAADLLVLDLRGLEFIECVAVEAILEADRRVGAGGGRLLVVRGPSDVQWTFELIDAQGRLEFVDEPPPVPLTAPPRESVLA